MAKITIEEYPTTYEFIDGIGFAFCSSPKDGRRQVTEFVSCKAFLQDIVHDQLYDDDVSGFLEEDSPPVDMNKLRLLIAEPFSDDEPALRKRVYSAKRVINFYEEVAGWQPSKIVKIYHSKCKHVWLLTGPKQWMSAPQLLSMVTLLIRLFIERGPIKFKTNEDLEALYKEWCRKEDFGDGGYLYHCWDKLFLVMKYYNKLFKGFKPKELHTDEGGVTSHHNGISYLCQFMSATKELNERFREIYEKTKKVHQ